jgi:hypothetical protein
MNKKGQVKEKILNIFYVVVGFVLFFLVLPLLTNLIISTGDIAESGVAVFFINLLPWTMFLFLAWALIRSFSG